MSKKSIYGILAVIIVLGALLFLTQKMFSGGTGSGSGTPGSPPPGQPGQLSQTPPAKFTEAQLRASWKQLIAFAPPPRGPAAAPYTVVEIGDFECPQCGRVKPAVQAMLQASGGQAKLYFYNWPLTHIHPHAMDAAEAGDAAAAQGKFWPMYDMLYGDQSSLQAGAIQADARTIAGISPDKLIADMNSHKYRPVIEAQSALISRLGAMATPTFLIRAPDGNITWYVGRTGTSGDKGLRDLAEHPPWGGGMSDDQFSSLTADPNAV